MIVAVTAFSGSPKYNVYAMTYDKMRETWIYVHDIMQISVLNPVCLILGGLRASNSKPNDLDSFRLGNREDVDAILMIENNKIYMTKNTLNCMALAIYFEQTCEMLNPGESVPYEQGMTVVFATREFWCEKTREECVEQTQMSDPSAEALAGQIKCGILTLYGFPL